MVQSEVNFFSGHTKLDSGIGMGLMQMQSEIKIKMEEQTVPSRGFSPQPDLQYDSTGLPKLQQSHYVAMEDPSSYSHLAETFDLSLLGDGYDDQDMATVPSPSWLPSEPTAWQQMSLYASSPLGEFRAFSPECKPMLSPVRTFTTDSMSSMSPPCRGVPENNLIMTMNDVVSADIVSEHNQRNLLLRQCLEDTTFQRKYNFKPLELTSLLEEANLAAIQEIAATSTSTASEAVGSSLELNQIEPVFSLAFEQIRADIQNVCTSLAISSDPVQWTCTDVQSWLAHTMTSLGVVMPGDTLRQFWNVNGRTLCSWSEDEFRRRDPLSGDRVFAHLDLWKTSLQVRPSGNNVTSSTPAVDVTPPSPQLFDLEHLLLGSSTPVCPVVSNPPTPLPSYEDVKVKLEPVSLDVQSPHSSFLSPLPSESMNTDEDDDEEEEEDNKVKKSGKGASGSGSSGGKSGAHIHLWQFLKELLASPQQHGCCIRWLDQSKGVFKIEDSVRVARLWGLRKNRPAMNYDKLSRSIRQYYRKGIMRKTERSQRLVYQFCHPYGL